MFNFGESTNATKASGATNTTKDSLYTANMQYVISNPIDNDDTLEFTSATAIACDLEMDGNGLQWLCINSTSVEL